MRYTATFSGRLSVKARESIFLVVHPSITEVDNQSILKNSLLCYRTAFNVRVVIRNGRFRNKFFFLCARGVTGTVSQGMAKEED